MSEIAVTHAQLIEKETISGLKFNGADVLLSEHAVAQRTENLNRAILLGNNQKRKVMIVFEDDHSIKKVETTIWAVTERNILLKGGMFIPIKRIHSVSPY